MMEAKHSTAWGPPLWQIHLLWSQNVFLSSVCVQVNSLTRSHKCLQIGSALPRSPLRSRLKSAGANICWVLATNKAAITEFNENNNFSLSVILHSLHSWWTNSSTQRTVVPDTLYAVTIWQRSSRAENISSTSGSTNELTQSQTSREALEYHSQVQAQPLVPLLRKGNRYCSLLIPRWETRTVQQHPQTQWDSHLQPRSPATKESCNSSQTSPINIKSNISWFSPNWWSHYSGFTQETSHDG